MDVNEVLIITPKQKEIIRHSIERTDTEIEEEIQHLKDWLKKQQHLPQNEDENRLRTMLQFNKFSLEKTKNKLDMYYSIKHMVPEIYENREPLNPRVCKFMDDIVFAPLPKLTNACHRVYFMKFVDKDSTTFHMDLLLKFCFATFDLRMIHDPCLGDHFVTDFENASLGHIVKMSPVLIKKAYTLISKAYSDRIKGVHYLNLPAAGNSLVTLLKSILSTKLANRVFVHKNVESLQEALSKEVLPKEYGGDGGSLDVIYDNWKKFMKSKNSWLVELGERRSNEALRTGPPIESDLFGMCGSFRKLDLD